MRRQLKVARIKTKQLNVVHTRLGRGVRLAANLGHHDTEVKIIDTKTVKLVLLLEQRLTGINTTVRVADKSRNTGAGDGHHRSGRARSNAGLRSKRIVVVQADRVDRRILFEADTATEIGKVGDAEGHVAFGADELAHRTVKIQRDRAVGARFYSQALGRKIHHLVAGFGCLVQLDPQIFDCRQQIRQAHNAHAGSTGR